jgi:c-di-GMP-binding flagellar brake protein YcgR
MAIFETGQAAEIELNGMAEKYPTRIEDVRGDYLLIATPLKQREYVTMEQGKKVLLSVVRRNNPYFYETNVVGMEWVEGQQLTQLRRPADNAGITLRQHVRVAVTITDAQFWVEGEDGKFGSIIPGSVVDISAGGVQLITKNGLPTGANVLMRATLSRQAGTLMVNVMVLRDYERVSDVGVKTHRAHCSFHDLPDKDREKLVKFVFQRERELRQKGVL